MPSWVSCDPSLKISLKDLVERSDTVKNVLCFHMGEAVFVSLHVFTAKIFFKNVKQSFCYQQCLTKAT